MVQVRDDNGNNYSINESLFKNLGPDMRILLENGESLMLAPNLSDISDIVGDFTEQEVSIEEDAQNNSNQSNAAIQHQPTDVSEWMANINHRLSAIESKQDAMKCSVAVALNEVLQKTVRMEKMFEDFLQRQQNAQNQENAQNFGPVQPPDLNEDFSEVNAMVPISTVEQLVAFENAISEENFQIKVIRFLQKNYKMNGAVNGSTFFTEVIRFISDPSVYLTFSWKGYRGNESFAIKHKGFVDFFKRIILLADKSKTFEDVNEMFEKILRFKKQNVVRDQLIRTTQIRKPTPRNRPPQRKPAPEITTTDNATKTEEEKVAENATKPEIPENQSNDIEMEE